MEGEVVNSEGYVSSFFVCACESVGQTLFVLACVARVSVRPQIIAELIYRPIHIEAKKCCCLV